MIGWPGSVVKDNHRPQPAQPPVAGTLSTKCVCGGWLQWVRDHSRAYWRHTK